MKIPERFMDELIARTDMAALVGEYVRLTKRAGGNMFGLCPFHSEKTPSFSLSLDKQIYYCFGCGVGGGAINFLMEIENLPFYDVVEVLAKRAGMPMPADNDESSQNRHRMLGLNREAARHFHNELLSPKGEAARQYLAKRKISKKMITQFGIGAAPDSWDSLLYAMSAKGYSRQELIDAGLARESKKETGNGGAYDFFRNRLMFPVIDVRGNVIGFSGRDLGEGESYKYLNSPDTTVFAKNRNLFALNVAKKTKSGMLILAEGNIDVIALHEAGFDGAVASLGTSLTENQVRLMSRYAGSVAIAYDSDEAGRRAVTKAMKLFEKTDMNVKIIDLGDSKDPDDFLKTHGSDAFAKKLEISQNHIEYRLMTIKSDANLLSDEGRLEYLQKATRLLADLSGSVEREIYGVRVAEAAEVSYESVKNEVAKMRNKKERYEKRMARVPKTDSLTWQQTSNTAEEGVIRCLMSDPELLAVSQKKGFSAIEFTSPLLSKIYQKISDREEINTALIMSELEPGEASQLTRILHSPVSIRNDRAIVDYIEKIRLDKPGNSDEELLSVLMARQKKHREMKDVGG